MTNKTKRGTSARTSGVEATTPGRPKTSKATPQTATPPKHGNTGRAHEAGDHMVQGASHQGSSLGKRNSG